MQKNRDISTSFYMPRHAKKLILNLSLFSFNYNRNVFTWKYCVILSRTNVMWIKKINLTKDSQAICRKASILSMCITGTRRRASIDLATYAFSSPEKFSDPHMVRIVALEVMANQKDEWPRTALPLLPRTIQRFGIFFKFPEGQGERGEIAIHRMP